MTRQPKLLPAPQSRETAASGFVQILLLILILLGVTTYGIVAFQAEVVRSEARLESKNTNVLETARQALIDYAFGEGIRNYKTRFHILPGLDYYDSTIDDTPFFFIPARYGQLPCPDVTGDGSPPSRGALSVPHQLSRNDQNLDGVADYSDTLGCSLELVPPPLPLVHGSRTGRLPWGEYFDHTSIIRGVDSPFPLIDRNGDRLWYSVSRNLVNLNQPINQYSLLRQDEGWLTLVVTAFSPADESNLRRPGFANDLTITGVAALVISPGKPSEAQSNRRPESQVYGPGALSEVLTSADASLYLETSVGTGGTISNLDNDNIFSTGSGHPPPHIDQIAHISKEELIPPFDRISVDENLDRIADLLSDHNEKYGSLPDPASAESSSTDAIDRSLGSFSSGVNVNLYSPEATSTNLGGLVTVNLRGGRVEYALNPVSPVVTTTVTELGTGVVLSTVTAAVIENLGDVVPLESALAGSQVPDIFIPLQTSVSLVTGASSVHAFDIPLNDLLYPALTPYTPGSRQVALSRWEGVIPAGEPFRAAAPFYITNDPNHTGAPPSNVSLTVRNPGGAYNSLAGDYNLIFGDLRPGVLRDTAPLGYSVLMPRGTWIVASVDISVSGTESQLLLTPRRPSPNIAFRPQLDDSDIVQFGVTRDLAATSPEPPVVASKTALVAGNHGLLPVPLVPGQQTDTSTDFPTPSRRYLVPTNLNITTTNPTDAVVIDPLGAVGTFRAAVTLHPRASFFPLPAAVPLIASNSNVPFDNEPLNQLNTPLSSDSVVAPYPFFNGDGSVNHPGQIVVNGPISVPVGTKFFYPFGMRIYLDGRLPNIENPLDSPDRLFAHLPAGTVLHDVKVHNTAGNLLPNGQVVTDLVAAGIPTVPIGSETAASFTSITLVNGGRLGYSFLSYYHDGEISTLPQTSDQAAFRIEGKFGLHDGGTNVDGFLSTNPTLLGDAQDGYLYPGLGVYDQRAFMLNPAPSISIGTAGTLTFRQPVAGSGNFEAIENPLARAEIFSYDFGESTTTITVTQVPERLELNVPPDTFTTPLLTVSSTYALIDQYGLGIEWPNDNFAISSTVNVTNDIVLDLGLGVTMQANPGRMLLTNSLADTVHLSFNQFGSPESNTPLVLSYLPELTANAAVEVVRGGALATLDARMSELALHLDNATTIASPDFAIGGYAAPSDRLVLGANTITMIAGTPVTLPDLTQAARAYVKFDTDAVLVTPTPTPATANRQLIPAATRAEFGLLEHFDIGSGRNTRHLLPSARLFADVGYYPIPSGAAVRPFRDVTSLDGPAALTVSLVVDPAAILAAQTLVLPSLERTQIVINSDQTLNLAAPAATADPVNDVVLAADSTFVLTRPRLAIPGGQDALPFETDTTDPLNPYITFTDDAVFLADQIEHVTGGVTTALNAGSLPVSATTSGTTPNFPTEIVLPFASTADIMDVGFTFILDDGGMTTTGGLTPVPLDAIQPKQIMRMRFAINQGVDGSPDLLPIIDLSWGNRERSDIQYSDFVPEDIIFAQNNPLFYAVADICRSYTKRIVGDCVEARQGGLSVQVLPGEQVRLPADEPAPPGLIIHGFKHETYLPQQITIVRPNPAANFGLNPFSALDQSDSANVSVAVDGLRIRPNGEIGILEFANSINELNDNGDALSFPSGTTLVLLPGQRGVMFRYEPVEQSVYAMSQPQDADRHGYQEQLLLVQGGFTAGNQFEALHQITVAANNTITLASDSVLVGSFNDPDEIGSIELAPGSIINDGSAPRSASNYQLIGGYTQLEIPLDSNAVLFGSGQQLPEIARSGTTVTLNPSDATFDSRSALMELPVGTVVTITGTNRAIQAHLTGASGGITLSLANDASTLINYYARVYEDNAPRVGPQPREVRDLAMPTRSSLDTSLLADTDPLSYTATAAALDLVGTPGSCWLCGLGTQPIDVSGLASSGPDPAGAYTYPSAIIVMATLARKISPEVTIDSSTATTDMLVYSVATLTIDTVSGTDTLNAPIINLNIAPYDPAFTGYGNVTLLQVPSNIPLNEFRETSIPPVLYENTAILGSDVTVDLGTLDFDHAGVALDRFGSTEPLLITIGNDIEFPGPLALYSSPDQANLAFPVLDASPPGTPTPAGAPISFGGDQNQRQAQLFFDNPEARLLISGAERVGIQLTDENMVIDGRSVPPGSILYPQIGRILLARELPLDEATDLPLSIGVSGNVVGGSASGRPRTLSRNGLIAVNQATVVTPPQSGNLPLLIGFDNPATGVAVDLAVTTTGTQINSSLYYTHPAVTIRDIDTRRMDAVLYPPAFVRPPSLGSNLITTSLAFLPALHRILFPDTGNITLYPPASRAEESVNNYIFPANTTLSFSLPSPSNAGDTAMSMLDGYEFRNRIDAPGQLQLASDGPGYEVDVQAFSLTLASLEQDRIRAFSEPVQQYLWLRTANDFTITNTLTNEERELPANTVINPLLGTYLTPEYRAGNSAPVTLRIGTTNPAIAGSAMVFSRPAMILPRGVTLDVGTQSVSFTDVKGLIAHSAQPLRRDISCAAYPGGAVDVNQLDEGRNVTVLLQPEYGYVGSRPSSFPNALGSLQSDYGHPCLLLDIAENTDLDKQFVYTSNPLRDASNFDVVANDRMRIIGGRLQL